ncbi:MAG: hypothetical protein WCP28_04175 [Actinomycetes bacterium]
MKIKNFVPALVAVAPLVVLMAGCGSSSGPSPSSSAPNPSGTSSSGGGGADCGVHEVNGVQVRTFCGTGTVSVTTGGKTMTLNTAECSNTAQGFAVNAGTIVLQPSDTAVRKTTQYFGIAIVGSGAVKDGTYSGIASGNDSGTALSTNAAKTKITVAGGATNGSVDGVTLQGAPLKATFSCS